MLERNILLACRKCLLKMGPRWGVLPVRSINSSSSVTSSGSPSVSEKNIESEELYSENRKTHFGSDTVTEQEKAKKVFAVFENVAEKYDIMNDVMSGGVHRIWKDIFVHRLRPDNKTKLIDVAGGTGDIAFRFLKYNEPKKPNFDAKNLFFNNNQSKTSKNIGINKDKPSENESELNRDNNHSESSNESFGEKIERSVLLVDINPKMSEVGRKRAEKVLKPDELSRISWMDGDAENLVNIPDNSFDAYTIAYGIRNCVHIDKVLKEAYRVLKPGGRFMCLELSHVSNPALKKIYDEYSFKIIPVMGQIVSGDWDSYEYLVHSIRRFPNQETFKKMIMDAGFRFVSYENLTFGVCSIHSGFKTF